MGTIREGERAPDFTLRNQSGEFVSLHDFAEKRNVVLYFYPRDFTPGCTAEAKTFTANYEKFREAGAEVVGVSSDSVESHGEFAEECSVPYTLLSDKGGEVRRSYGVRNTLGVIPGRVSFIIDKHGVVRHVFSSQFRPREHVQEALEVLGSISKD